MEKMGETLDRLFDRLHLKRELREQSVFAVWDRCVGETVARHAQPAAIRDGNLLVHVTDSPHLTEYHYLKAELTRKLNALLGRGTVREIQFRVGEVKRPAPPRPEPAPSRPTLLEAGVREAIEEAVAKIADPEVRESVRRYLLAAAKPAPRPPGP